jgi:hypothetical protein
MAGPTGPTGEGCAGALAFAIATWWSWGRALAIARWTGAIFGGVLPGPTLRVAQNSAGKAPRTPVLIEPHPNRVTW